ncbi:hypothetical protein AU468_09055 [Alkalispirochaeta sphaeroplastigenens]|uniref:Uncharacterized protein n=1 Tax=Alkalispirochaeta sphaeroplastigenens TaxID=1187066 RepID=A0A2S4JN97_9SPIO|nr:hypothetical protein AU468_09055 [Alkalispirochaeta sphaeroplastigenens]
MISLFPSLPMHSDRHRLPSRYPEERYPARDAPRESPKEVRKKFPAGGGPEGELEIPGRADYTIITYG